jgi:hypothetical protein
MTDEIQKAVVRAVWPWDVPAAPPRDDRPRLRRKALIQALVMAAVAALFFFFWRGHVVLPAVLAGLAALNLLLGLAAPRAFGAIDRALQAFGRGCGIAVTWLVLTLLFYLFFLPARLILLAARRDPLERRFPDTPTSYWVPRRSVKSMDDYRKQF